MSEDGCGEGLVGVMPCQPELFVRVESSRSIERVLRSGKYMLVDVRAM